MRLPPQENSESKQEPSPISFHPLLPVCRWGGGVDNQATPPFSSSPPLPISLPRQKPPGSWV